MCIMELSAYLKHARCHADLAALILCIANQALPIRDAFSSNQMTKSTKNASGEIQAGMDVWADRHLIDYIGKTRLVRELASEEQDDIIVFPDATGSYSVVMDPLDGSSLIATNLSVGTIIGIYTGSLLKKGEDLTAALYLLYGPMTELVISIGDGVHSFVLDEKTAEYQLFHEHITIPEGTQYGSGGIRREWIPAHIRVLEYFDEHNFKVRYSGSFVADCHQLLTYGGIYTYPALEKKPQGKLRLLFEVNPLGYIITQAGGAVTDGYRNTLTIVPEKIHQKSPVYIGSKGVIQAIEEIYRGF
jgi:fructose-1,6-bisphosphatase I